MRNVWSSCVAMVADFCFLPTAFLPSPLPPNPVIERESTDTMENDQRPTLSNGKVCYIEIPAIDINTSASFYNAVFGWRIRQRGDGHLAFDDAV